MNCSRYRDRQNQRTRASAKRLNNLRWAKSAKRSKWSPWHQTVYFGGPDQNSSTLLKPPKYPVRSRFNFLEHDWPNKKIFAPAQYQKWTKDGFSRVNFISQAFKPKGLGTTNILRLASLVWTCEEFMWGPECQLGVRRKSSDEESGSC